ncbi:Protein LicA [Frankliniella fusca]|uniref:Protein LicA n=1 Tax=Frankliniella fusca TaxID=407009 RepID=A0AAE1HTT6_9NEOP|nr:Protein LicA [Frankliniella fusca]
MTWILAMVSVRLAAESGLLAWSPGPASGAVLVGGGRYSRFDSGAGSLHRAAAAAAFTELMAAAQCGLMGMRSGCGRARRAATSAGWKRVSIGVARMTHLEQKTALRRESSSRSMARARSRVRSVRSLPSPCSEPDGGSSEVWTDTEERVSGLGPGPGRGAHAPGSGRPRPRPRLRPSCGGGGGSWSSGSHATSSGRQRPTGPEVCRSTRSLGSGSIGTGTTPGSVNGSANGSVNGSANGSVNGSANGSVNGSANGSVNVSVNGSANGSANGSVNGSLSTPSDCKEK